METFLADMLERGLALDAVIAEDGGRLQAIAANLQAWFSTWVANGVFAA